MRYIEKRGGEFHFLEEANREPPLESAEARSRWHSFRRNKVLLSQALKNEQNGLCAYSEINPEENGLGTHIEHIEPKSCKPERTFDYLNLVLSALNSQDLSEQNDIDRFGGHARSRSPDLSRFISPLQEDSSSYFIYTSDGHISPAEGLSDVEKAKAEYTIEELNLDCDYLVVMRRKWIDELDGLIDKHITNGDSISCLAEIYLTPTSNKLYQFYSANYHRLSSFLEPDSELFLS